MEYRKEITEEIEDLAWDNYVQKSVDGHYTQMALWARVKAVQGWKPIRVKFFDGDTIIGGAQILWRTVWLNIRMGYVSKGPLIPQDDPEFIKQVIQDLQKIAKEHHLAFLAVQPPNKGQQIEALLPALNMNLNHQGDIEKPATMRLDLTRDLDTILNTIPRKKRRCIRQGLQSGFEIRVGTREDLAVFHQLHSQTGYRNGFDVQSMKFYEMLWDVFAPKKMIQLFLCSKDGKDICTEISILLNDTMERYRLGWNGEYPKLFPNEALMWFMISWGKANDFQWLDFGGLDFAIAQEYQKTSQIPEEMMNTYSAGKLHYDGEVQIFPQTYEYFYQPGLRRSYDFINHNPIFRKILKKGYQMIRSR